MIRRHPRGCEQGVDRINPKLARFNPSPLGGVEALLGGQLGVVMRNELSSGYSVRGGNFDENLVYVNDIEVYRPFLVRAGQQEGLSFPNPDMIERITFSAGGFEARYGDKMSSVLDIKYRRPREFAGSAMASLLGGALHVEDAMFNMRLRHVTGVRYRTNQLLLGGGDVKGDYRPVYTDAQTYWTYDLTDKVELGFLGLYSRNQYNVVPDDRQTEFGPFNQALRFTVFFDGQERTQFETLFGALNLNVQARKDLLLKFIASAYSTAESERFTIQGQYRLGEWSVIWAVSSSAGGATSASAPIWITRATSSMLRCTPWPTRATCNARRATCNGASIRAWRPSTTA
ncbi:MAG: TonB-dependent receptor plug domain-containing protein [Flavobacteriales bacterium]|nr:TonB-dependent receptor plug domain-containing protein [Flavobacteriales bacterium]